MKEGRFSAGDRVTSEGQSGVGLFGSESGEAKVSVGGEDRRRLGPGDYFGEVALLNESARPATITAASDLKAHRPTPWDFRPPAERPGTIPWNLPPPRPKTHQPPPLHPTWNVHAP